MNNLKQKIRENFSEIGLDAWLEQLQKDLKGASINETLLFCDEIEDLDFKSHFHWQEGVNERNAPLIKKEKQQNTWVVLQNVLEIDAKKANSKALQLLNEGSTGIAFSNLDHAESRYKDILFEHIHSEFQVRELLDMPAILNNLPKNASATFRFDPVSIGKTTEIKDYIDTTEAWTNLRCFQINNHQFASAGANCSQQLGILCSQVSAYFKILTNIGVSADLVAQKVEVNLGIGSNYIFEIAKFRSAHILLQHICNAYGVGEEQRIKIKATSIMMNKSLEDPYTNLLRLTTEGMSAVIGGVDILELQPYDLWSKNGPSDFSYRMSNNISNLLMEESCFHYVQDAGAGAYSIELATTRISEKAYSLFQNIEKSGGYNAAIFTGLIENEIYQTAEKRKKNFDNGTMKLVGINAFPNPEKFDLQWQIPNAAFTHLVFETTKKGVQA